MIYLLRECKHQDVSTTNASSCTDPLQVHTFVLEPEPQDYLDFKVNNDPELGIALVQTSRNGPLSRTPPTSNVAAWVQVQAIMFRMLGPKAWICTASSHFTGHLLK